jgi:hypothetical protein
MGKIAAEMILQGQHAQIENECGLIVRNSLWVVKSKVIKSKVVKSKVVKS